MKFNNRFKKLNINDFKHPFDLIIIGGGINGAGLAKEASEKGLKVLLLEKKDFASGTTGNSTRLIHGGLRYLEFFEFGLVYESLNEREELLHQYPNLVRPIKMLLPHYSTNKVGKIKLNLGMILYDLLSPRKSLTNHKTLSKEACIENYQEINTEDLDGGFEYYDAQASFVERICLENILIAQSLGALCINHSEVTSIHCKTIQEEIIAGTVEFRDNIETTNEEEKVYRAHGKHIINMSGPWVDKINQHLDIAPEGEENTPSISAQRFEIKRLIGGTKGSHIVVKPFYGAPIEHGVYTEAKSDHRPVFVLPFQVGENDPYILIGTTDIFTEENLDKIEISDKEIEYLLNEANVLYPEANLNRDSVVKTYTGIRPLPHVSKARKEGAITRRHFIHKHSEEGIKNYYSVVGGKLTTFRSLAHQMLTIIAKEDPEIKKTVSESNETKNGKRLIERDFDVYLKKQSESLSKEYSIDQTTVDHLIKIYYEKAKNVLDIAKRDPSLKNKISKDYQDIEAQIIYAIEEEKACSLEDIFYRRLSIGLFEEKPSRSTKEVILKHLSNMLTFSI